MTRKHFLAAAVGLSLATKAKASLVSTPAVKPITFAEMQAAYSAAFFGADRPYILYAYVDGELKYWPDNAAIYHNQEL